MLKKLELPYELHAELVKYCDTKKIRFLSTAFDHQSLDFLVSELGLATLKISSGDITNAPLLLSHARSGKDVILSTGMSTLGEIEDALGVLAFGYLESTKSPSCAMFKEAYCSVKGKQLLHEKVTLLHCTTEYPAPLEDINLNAMATLSCAFGLKTGYSDHSKGIVIPVAAAALGACVIEKHFTLDREMNGPDHRASLEPDELKEMVTSIRAVEKAMGSHHKGPQPSELGNLSIARKSLIATRSIKIGEEFTVNNIGVKRPGNGRNPMKYWDVLGDISDRAYEIDEVIK